MPSENEDAQRVDPLEALRSLQDTYLDSLSKIMINAVNSEEYAQATGTMLNSSMAIAAPFREALDKTAAVALQQTSLPSRQELASLAERFTHVEIRLDDMDAKLDRVAGLLSARQAGAASGKRGAAEKKKPPQTSRRKR